MSGDGGASCDHPPIAILLLGLQRDGATRSTLNLARALAARGERVDLLVPRLNGRRSLMPAGPEVLELPAGHWRRLGAIAGYLRDRRPSVLLQARDGLNFASLAVWLSRVSCRVVLVTRTPLPHLLQDPAEPRGRRLTLRWLRWLISWADDVVAVSEGVAAEVTEFAQMPSERVHVIPNPVVGPDFEHRAVEPVEHPWFAPGGKPVILGVGRLEPVKDFATLMRAFAAVRTQMEARLVLLGEGSQRGQLERLAEELGVAEDVALPGYLANSVAHMAKATVVVLSSRYEGLGTVLVEAIATGTPVVATDCPGGPAEILAEGRYGPLVPVEEPAALAQAMLAVMRAPPDAALLHERARDFSFEAAVERYLTVLRPTGRRDG